MSEGGHSPSPRTRQQQHRTILPTRHLPPARLGGHGEPDARFGRTAHAACPLHAGSPASAAQHDGDGRHVGAVRYAVDGQTAITGRAGSWSLCPAVTVAVAAAVKPTPWLHAAAPCLPRPPTDPDPPTPKQVRTLQPLEQGYDHPQSQPALRQVPNLFTRPLHKTLVNHASNQLIN